MKEIRLSIPEGCKVVTVKVDGCKVTTEFEPKEEVWFPKDGDFYAIDNGNGTSSISIYNGNYTPNFENLVPFYCGINIDKRLVINNSQERCVFGEYYEIRPATEAEKQRLLDALAKEGKRWNAEKKQIEDLPRWRAEKREEYFYVTFRGTVREDKENRCGGDDACYYVGNYFKSREAAERVAKQIREIFKNSKPE